MLSNRFLSNKYFRLDSISAHIFFKYYPHLWNFLKTSLPSIEDFLPSDPDFPLHSSLLTVSCILGHYPTKIPRSIIHIESNTACSSAYTAAKTDLVSILTKFSSNHHLQKVYPFFKSAPMLST